MKLLLFIPLVVVTACLRENGAFDGDNSGGSASTTVAPTSGPTGSGEPTSSTAAGTTSSGTGTQTGTDGTAPSTGAATTDGTSAATTGEPLAEPTLCGKPSGAWAFGAVKKLGMPVNAPKGDLDMWLHEPGMVLMWSSYRDDKLDTYRATRKGFGADFDLDFHNNEDIGLSTPGQDTKITLSRDGERAYLATQLPGDPDYRLYMGDRMNGGYAPLTQVPLDFPGYPNVVDPHISNDDLRLYYAASRGDQRLVVATRPGPDQPFGAPSAAPFVNVDEVDRPEADPTLPAHELVVLYARGGDIGVGGIDIYYAERASTSDAFGAPKKFPVVNSELHDMSPHLSRDGCELFFIRGTDEDPHDWDIYRVEIQ